MLEAFFDRIFRNDLNANFEDIDKDIQAVNTRVENIASNAGNSNTEIVDARQELDGTSHMTLRAHTNAIHDKIKNVTSQLAEKASQEDLKAQGIRIDNIIATAGDGTTPTELTDVRVVSGKTFTTAGEAVRAVASGDALDSGGVFNIFEFPAAAQSKCQALNVIKHLEFRNVSKSVKASLGLVRVKYDPTTGTRGSGTINFVTFFECDANGVPDPAKIIGQFSTTNDQLIVKDYDVTTAYGRIICTIDWSIFASVGAAYSGIGYQDTGVSKSVYTNTKARDAEIAAINTSVATNATNVAANTKKVDFLDDNLYNIFAFPKTAESERKLVSAVKKLELRDFDKNTRIGIGFVRLAQGTAPSLFHQIGFHVIDDNGVAQATPTVGSLLSDINSYVQKDHTLVTTFGTIIATIDWSVWADITTPTSYNGIPWTTGGISKWAFTKSGTLSPQSVSDSLVQLQTSMYNIFEFPAKAEAKVPNLTAAIKHLELWDFDINKKYTIGFVRLLYGTTPTNSIAIHECDPVTGVPDGTKTVAALIADSSNQWGVKDFNMVTSYGTVVAKINFGAFAQAAWSLSGINWNDTGISKAAFKKSQGVKAIVGLGGTGSGLSFTNTLKVEQPIISLVDDDSPAEFLSKTKVVCDNLGIKCTVATVPANIDNNSWYMTLQNLIDLKAAGFEIASHSWSHDANVFKSSVIDMTQVTDDAIRTEFKKAYDYMKINGFNTDYVVYPWGGYGTEKRRVKKIASEFHQFGVDSSGGAMGEQVLDNMFYKRIFITDANGLDYYKGIIDTCLANKQWLIFGTHSGSTEVTAGFMQSVLQYAKDKGIAIMLFSQANEIKRNIASVGMYEDKSNRLFIGRGGVILNT